MAPTPQTDTAQRPSETNNPTTTRGHKTAWIGLAFAIALFLLLALLAYHLYARLRARRLGLPPPSLNPFRSNRTRASPSRLRSGGGIISWVQDKLNLGGDGYTGTGVRSGRRGFGALDPDEAWDARVGNEADGYGYGQVYGGEEQELGVRPPPAAGAGGGGEYHGRGYGPEGGLEEIETKTGRGRGRAAKEELDERYDEVMHGGDGARGAKDPFGDDAERSKMGLRGVSPRPHVADDDSPTERRSMFREEV